MYLLAVSSMAGEAISGRRNEAHEVWQQPRHRDTAAPSYRHDSMRLHLVERGMRSARGSFREVTLVYDQQLRGIHLCRVLVRSSMKQPAALWPVCLKR